MRRLTVSKRSRCVCIENVKEKCQGQKREMQMCTCVCVFYWGTVKLRFDVQTMGSLRYTWSYSKLGSLAQLLTNFNVYYALIIISPCTLMITSWHNIFRLIIYIRTYPSQLFAFISGKSIDWTRMILHMDYWYLHSQWLKYCMVNNTILIQKEKVKIAAFHCEMEDFESLHMLYIPKYQDF